MCFCAILWLYLTKKEGFVFKNIPLNDKVS